MMMRWLVIMLGLVGCGGTGDGLTQGPAQRVFVAGDTFDIRQQGVRAVAIRVNSRWVPNRAAIEGSAARAIRVATRCDVLAMTGDQALIHALLDCDADQARPLVIGVPERYFDCEADWIEEEIADLTCYASG